MSRVIIVETDYKGISDKIKPILFDVLHNVNAEKVLLKPNLLAGAPPERVISTHPDFVYSIVKILEEGGKKVVVSDNPGVSGYGSSKKAAIDSGMYELIKERFENPAESALRITIASKYTDSFVVSGNILNAEFLINLPKFKTHSLTLFSGAIKNMFGILVGGEKAKAHSLGRTRDEFAELLVDIYNIRIPELTIMDAVWGMEGSGPTNGKRRVINKVLISEDGFALDAVCAKMMGIEPYEIPYLRVAMDRGILNPDKIEIDGNFDILENFRLPPTFSINNFVGRSFIGFVNSFIFEHFVKGPARLKLIEKRCTKCHICVRQCPVGAMEKREDGYPFINKDKCIGCYCCDELCPEGAWRIAGIMRLIRR